MNKTHLTILIGCIVVSALTLFSADNPEIAPLNPDFVAWQVSLSGAQRSECLVSSDGYGLGYIPSPVDWSHLYQQTPQYQHLRLGAPPSYDLRTLNGMTFVRDQGSCGSCWAFGTYGSLESYLRKTLGQTWDFSEQNMKNMHGYDWSACAGGNCDISTAYLTRWGGPINESDDPYKANDSTPRPGLAVQKYLKTAKIFSTPDDIKNAVMNTGAVATYMYYDPASYNPSTCCYYYSGSANENHVVTIAGWDDNKVVAGAPANGAWLVKNSWGTAWGDNGYFWISYSDTKGCKIGYSFIEAVQTNTYTKNYYFDTLGRTGDVGYSKDSAWCANVFVPTGNDTLVAVGFYAVSNNTSYQITIYDSLRTSTGRFYNQLGTTASGTLPNAGYYTISLPAKIYRPRGNNFGVVIKFKTPGYNYPIPVEIPIANYSSKARARTGQSYTSSDGTNFSDITTGPNAIPNTNVCIRALCTPASLIQPNIQASNVLFSNVQSRKMTVSWTKGNGAFRAVFMRQTTSDIASPGYQTTYSANPAYGLGDQAGTGWYCVYNGTGTNVTVTNLTANTAYRVHVCEYNGSPGNEWYNNGYGTANPANRTSAANRAPILDSIRNRSVNEGQALTFTITASDPDTGDVLTYMASNLPTGASFDPSTRIFTWTPGYTQAGTYSGVKFKVTDNGSPVLSDSETITITVNNVNRPPDLAAIGNKSVDENATLTFTVSATDPDGNTLAYSTANLPTGASFDPLTRTFTWTPGYTQAGTYAGVKFKVTDNGSPVLSDSETITITVNNVNRPPELAAIENKSVDENAPLTFTVSATDPDGDALTYSAANLPNGASFDPLTQTFSWSPDFTQAGLYANVKFVVYDNGSPVLGDSELITITVNNVNRAPELATVGDKSVDENATLTFTVSATDPDGDGLTYSATDLPTGANFDPLTQTFSWSPDYTQAGLYANVKFVVYDNGSPVLGDSELITITVNNVNRAPELATVGDKSVDENATLTFTVSATDPDGDGLTYSAADLPTGASFDPLTQTFTWTPDYTQAGVYANVKFVVYDNGSPVLGDSELITITVNNVNRAPELATVGDKSVDENATLTFTVSATDPDGDTLTYSAADLPAGASFDSLTQTFTWRPNYSQAGIYADVKFVVYDNGSPVLGDSELITITVNNVNRAPELAPVGDKSVDENATLTFTVSATDPDGDGLTYSAVDLPAGASFDPLTQTFTWTPDYTQAGVYANVKFVVYDNGSPVLGDSELITITVNNVNRVPELATIGDKSVDENAMLTFTVSATDPDGDGLTYSAVDLPTGASFDPLTQTFTWTPDYTQAGLYSNVKFVVYDNGSPVLGDSELITITVNNVNRAPELAPVGDKSVDENATLTFTVSAVDPDGDVLTYSAADLPAGASFDPSTQTFTWTPDYTQAGLYANAKFVVFDNGSPVLGDSELITITVNNVNRAPELATIGDKSVDENATLTFTVSATDPDGNGLTYSAVDLPTGASFDPLTQTFTWSPDYTQAGLYANVKFVVFDNGSPVLGDSELITITVNNVNRAPELATIGDKSVDENATLTFTVSATDPDGDGLTYSATDLPTGASFDPLTQTFTWTPDFTQAGVYANVKFVVYDNGSPVLGDSELITITVNPVGGSRIIVNGLDTGAQVFIYATSGWYGKYQFNGNNSITVDSGQVQHLLCIRQNNRRTEYIPVAVRIGADTTVTVAMQSTVPVLFDSRKPLVDKSGDTIRAGKFCSGLMDDMDGNGARDLVLVDMDGKVSVYYNVNDSLVAGDTFQILLGMDEIIGCARLVDADYDDTIEVMYALTNGKIVIHEDAGDAVYYTSAKGGLSGFDLFDVNGDHQPDLLLGYSDGTVEAALSNGDGTWQSGQPLTDASGSPISVTANASPLAFDMNGDGVQDLVVGNEAGEVRWFVKNANGTLTKKNFVNAGGAALTTADNAAVSFTYGKTGALPGAVVTDGAGNVFTAAAVLQGDITRDGKVDIFDLNRFGKNWGRTGEDPLWDGRVNLAISYDGAGNPDPVQRIDIFDLNVFGKSWGLKLKNN